MTPAAAACATPPGRRKPGAIARSLFQLTKPRIIELLLVTTIPAMLLAQRGLPSLRVFAVTLIGGTLAAASANTLNCYLDRDIDPVMRRTAHRPLAAKAGRGTIKPGEALYHQRWESENGYAELKTRLRGAAFILRSRSPELVHQELFALLTVYQALCALEAEAARQAGIDPDRISFTVTVRIARDHAASHTVITPRTLDLARRQAIGDLLGDILPRRRDRQYERVRKQPKNNFPPMKQGQQRPPSRITYKIKVSRKASSPAQTP